MAQSYGRLSVCGALPLLLAASLVVLLQAEAARAGGSYFDTRTNVGRFWIAKQHAGWPADRTDYLLRRLMPSMPMPGRPASRHYYTHYNAPSHRHGRRR